MPRTVVGLDIGSAEIRAVEAKCSGRSVSVHRSGSVALPPGAVEGGLVRDRAAVTEALRQLWSETKIANRSVRLGVSSGSVLVRQLELDWMPDADLRRSLRYQVGDLLPVAVEDANLDHVLLGDGEVPGENGQPRRVVRILLVATARTAVDDLVRCVQAAKLQTVAADLAAFALVRVAQRAARGGAAESEPEAVIDIGVDKVSVAVHTRGRPHFVRVVPGIGGGLLTRALVEQTGCSWAEAEEFKRTPGVLETPDGRPIDRDGAVLVDGVRRMLDELRTTLDFHAQSDPETAPTRATLTGQGALMPGLVDRCAATLGIPVRLLDAGAALTPRGPGQADPAGPTLGQGMSVPLGLCLGLAS
ncbi:type IV pilus assembly protein PilM [Nocardioides sp.]|uniref:type IV pilus assembly protein PilM n=1 Tax=Nocardioides sp. TaxID=35761 RepID=UPI00356A6510